MKRLALAMTILVLALPALADEAPNVPRAKGAVVAYLELDEVQVAQFDALVEDTQAVVAPLREELETIEAELRELLAGEDPDPTAVGVLVVQGKGLREQMAEANSNYVKAFESILAPRQTARFLAVRRAARLQPVLPAFRVFHLLPR